MMKTISYKFECGSDKPNPDYPCDIQLHETVYQKTEVIPIKVEDNFQLDYGYSDYLDSESISYYCGHCSKPFTLEELLKFIVEEEE